MNYRIEQLNLCSANSAKTHCRQGRGLHVCLWIQFSLCLTSPVTIFLRVFLTYHVPQYSWLTEGIIAASEKPLEQSLLVSFLTAVRPCALCFAHISLSCVTSCPCKE